MNFASALISMKQGHLVRRENWDSRLMIGTDNELYFVSYFGPTISLREYPDQMHLLESMACDDWVIDDGMTHLGNCNDSHEHGDQLAKDMKFNMERYVLPFQKNNTTEDSNNKGE